MTPCRFWAQGNCRNGSTCRFEHIGPPGSNLQSSNRFGALGSTPNIMANKQGELPYGLNAEAIQRDLINECPPWILSCYGPGKDAPEQLFGGYPREQSFEEIRLHYLQGAMSGNPQGTIAELDGLYNNAQQQIQHTLTNLNAAIQFIVDARNKHPNRVDICQQSTPSGGTAGVFAKDKSAFGGTSNAFQSIAPTNSTFGAPASAAGAFGQPSALGQKPNPFGTPAFGQPSQPTSAFGQPATLGSNSPFGRPAQTTSAFGQTSTLGAKPSPFGTPAFGQPAQLPGAFGQPAQATTSPFGQPQAASKPAFGQPSQPAGGPAFGQPSQPVGAFGQPAALGQKPSPFGALAGPSPFASQQTASTPFGQPAKTTATTSPFGKPAQTTATASPFGQPATTAPASNPFGQPVSSSPFGQATTVPSNPFGQPQPAAQPSSPFGSVAPATTAAPANPFGKPASSSPFGQPAQAAANPFGQPTAQPASASPFSGAGSGGGGSSNIAATAKPAGQGHDPYPPNATRQHPDVSSYSSKGPDGRLRMFKGKPVSYQVLGTKSEKEVAVIRGFDGTVTRIWFPDGPPSYSTETEAADHKLYEDPKVREQWEAFTQNGAFIGGLMPEVPPLREFCTWDF